MTKLYEDSLRLSVDMELRNIRTLLDWAEEAGELRDKIQHVAQANRLLNSVNENLQALRDESSRGPSLPTPPSSTPSWVR